MPQRFRIEQVFGLQSCISTVCGCILTFACQNAVCPRFSNPCTATYGVGQLVFAGLVDQCGCFACASWTCNLMACCGCKITLGSCWCGCYLVPAGFLSAAGAPPICTAVSFCFGNTCVVCCSCCFCTCSFTFGNGIYMALGAVPSLPLSCVGITLFRRIS